MVSPLTGSTSSGSSSSASSSNGSSNSTGTSTTTSSGPSNGMNGLYGVVGSQTDNAINFSGLSTGIDTSQIIQEMLSIDRQPEKILQQDQQLLQQRQTAYNG